MSTKKLIGNAIRESSKLPGIKDVLFHPSVRGAVQHWPGLSTVYGKGWLLLHPIDRDLGTDTSGFIPTEELPSSPHDSLRKHCYAGSQPSIVRTALAALPSCEGFTFVDLGCGKGRPLLVASEFPFRDLVGVELSPSLAGIARQNAAILQKKWPNRVPVRVELGDASAFPLPAGNLVVFLYNPFGQEVIAEVVAGIEAALAAENRSLYVVYYNPVYGACFDASPALTRYFAATLPYSAEEQGYGPDSEDAVVIWQAGNAEPSHPGAEAQIEITIPSMRAELVPLTPA
jgi:SAM-dependent methyltransferase